MSIQRHITSIQHPLVKHLVKLRTDRDYRYEQKMVLIEGVKPVQEVSSSISKLIYVESHRPTLSHAVPEEWIITEAILKKISGMTSPEGVIAEVHMPSFSLLKGLNWVIALDGINDPGNLGTLLRTALAFGWEGVYLLPTSCDPYNEKALRAARGAHFRLPLASGTPEQLQQIVKENNLEPLVADLKGISVEKGISCKKGYLLVLGNEAHGASPDIHRFCKSITIPISNQMESLNVGIAGGILMYLLKRNHCK